MFIILYKTDHIPNRKVNRPRMCVGPGVSIFPFFKKKTFKNRPQRYFIQLYPQGIIDVLHLTCSTYRVRCLINIPRLNVAIWLHFNVVQTHFYHVVHMDVTVKLNICIDSRTSNDALGPGFIGSFFSPSPLANQFFQCSFMYNKNKSEKRNDLLSSVLSP